MPLRLPLLALAVLTALLCACSDKDVGSTATDEDTDGDGLTDARELELGTSPEVADSDADGFSDFDEVVTKAFNADIDNYQFNPLIADVPEASVRLTSAPDIRLEFKESNGTSRTIGTQSSSETGSEYKTAKSESGSYALERTHTYSVNVEVSSSISDPFGMKVSGGYQYEDSKTTESSFSTSQERARSLRETATDLESLEESSTATFEGGRLQLTGMLENTGRIAWTVKNIILSAYTLDLVEPEQRNPIGNLVIPDFQQTTRGVGEAYGPVTLSADLDLGTARELLSDPSGLVVRTPGLELLDADGRPFAHNTTTMRARTARVLIDYGVDPPAGLQMTGESYHVAVVTDGAAGIPVRTVFERILRIPYDTGTRPWRAFDAQEESDSESGLVAVRGVEMDSARTAYWMVVHSHKAQSGARIDSTRLNLLEAGYEFDSLSLRPGDVLHLLYVVDEDRDGLASRTEFRYGTDPLEPDSDGDGLTDLEEVLGWSITVDGVERAVRTSPLLADTDSDGFSDKEEYELRAEGSDPTLRNNAPPRITGRSIELRDGVRRRVAFDVEDLDRGDVVTEATVDWGDGSAPQTIVVGKQRMRCSADHRYGALGKYKVSVSCVDRSGARVSNDLEVSITSPDSGRIAHFPLDRSEMIPITMSNGSTFDRARIRDVVGGHHARSNLLNRDGSARDGAFSTRGVIGQSLSMGSVSSSTRPIVITKHIPFGAGGQAFTLSAWVKTGNLANTRLFGQDIWINVYKTGTNGRFGVGILNDTDEVAGARVEARSDTAPGQWIFVAATFSGGRLGIHQIPQNSPMSLSSNYAQVGALKNPGSCQFIVGSGHSESTNYCEAQRDDGKEIEASFDDLRIYNRALSEDELRALSISR